MERVILVDEKDSEIGTGGKMQVHREGKLHRAFSIFVFNSRGELLLQKRAASKYHCPGLWSNTVCSHPRPGEPTEAAAHRRLKEELGFDTGLKEEFTFIYKVKFDNGLTEHEFDHVFIGEYEGELKPNSGEVAATKWVSIERLKADVAKSPGLYTYWLREALGRVSGAREKHL